MRTFKPLRLRHLPYILLHKTQGRSLEQPPRHIKVPLPLYFPYGNTEGEFKCIASTSGEGGSICVSRKENRESLLPHYFPHDAPATVVGESHDIDSRGEAGRGNDHLARRSVEVVAPCHPAGRVD